MADNMQAGGWGMGAFAPPFGTPSQSTMQLSPAQMQNIQNQTAMMAQPAIPQPTPPPANPQQNTMMQGLMNFGGQPNPNAVPNYGQTANAAGLGAGTGGMSFPMFAGNQNGT